MEEEFTKLQTQMAIEQFLELGEKAYLLGYQNGYFSGQGWAARCLRSHLRDVEMSNPQFRNGERSRDATVGSILDT